MTITLIALAAVMGVMLVSWLASLRLNDVSIVDPVWGPAFVVVAVVAALAGHCGVRWLLLGMTALWGIRLGVHLTRRKLGERGEEDRRYAKLRAEHPDSFAIRSLVMIFLTQGVLVLVVSLPIQFAARGDSRLSALVIPGVVLWAVGLFFETVGDAQLAAFKRDPDSHGQVMDRGLWRYTRHPNYFGDFCVWWGIWLVALTEGVWWTFVGPAVMSLLLIRVSGAGLLEKDIGDRRPGYADYIRRTSAFFPRPPRR